MTMSIAFITLIFGFLLGKFTADRNHIIRDNHKRQNEIAHRPAVMQSEIDKVINSVIDAAKIKQLTNLKEHYSKETNNDEEGAKRYLKFFGENFTSCLREVTYENHIDKNLEDFMSSLLRNYYNVYLKCARELRGVLLTSD